MVAMLNNFSSYVCGLAVASSFAAVACTATEASSDMPTFDPAQELAEQTESKADGFSYCGDACSDGTCGQLWPEGASEGTYTCLATDNDARTSIKAQIRGAETISIDTTRAPFQPVYSLSNVYMYGSDTWKASNGTGFALVFKDVFNAGVIADDPTHTGPALTVWAPQFRGAGRYQAEGLLTVSVERKAKGGPLEVGNYYSTWGAHGGECTLNVRNGTGAAGGFVGEFACPRLYKFKDESRSVTIEGTFEIPATAIDQIFFVKKTAI